ncbi:MAG: transcription-repair coupling factor [Coriobacteriales bacterium]|jgi:transcription-repair coupling factor (superfamily II helicase)
MLIDAATGVLGRAKAVHEAFLQIDTGESPVLGAPPVVRPLLIAAAFARDPRPMLVVIAGEDTARKLAMALSLYLGRDKVLQLPLDQKRPWAPDEPDPAIAGKRIRALAALHGGEEVVVVASVRALMKRLAPSMGDTLVPLEFRTDEMASFAAAGDAGGEPRVIEYEELPAELDRLGYSRADLATEKGTFAVHGDVLDVFSPDAACPVRIEFYGDDVERIRRIVPSTGQTVSDVDIARIYPARETILARADVRKARERLSRAGILTYELEAEFDSIAELGMHGGQEQYLPFLCNGTCGALEFAHPRTLAVIVEPRSLFDDASRFHDELKSEANSAKAKLDGLYTAPAEIRFNSVQTLSILSLIHSGRAADGELVAKRAENPNSNERFVSQVRGLLAEGYTVVLGIGDRRLREEMKSELVDEHIPIVESTGDAVRELRKDVVNVVDAPIASAVIIPAAQLAMLNANDSVAAITEGADSLRSSRQAAITFPYKPGDYVVHQKYGVAHFARMEKQEIDGIWRDYLVLEYAAGDKLFIPVEQIAKISKYVGSKGEEPKLTRLNTTDWARAQAKASKAAKKLAFDLVDLYVRRSSIQGHAYAPDNEMQREMEALFPYEETSDQAQAIADVKADMESPQPMDRLVCGDVGYGKTEVAIRAAFKAVQDGRQVMVLCPTTILAQQHFTTFSERFEPFAVNVEILSRFRTAAQQRAALEGFAAGTVDVLVGTHRLLSRDVNPKNLGLVIIDEEQRFGVGHKEQLKNLREHIDVLTLTATPIPRTLQMSLGGIRDMSLIDTPPAFRTPVEVYVGEWDDGIVGGAIRREIQRGGQVYYVSSRIADIDDAMARVGEAVPEARVGFAHGRMGEAKLEDVMERFAAGELDVLVSTTIIESGLDNPHTNTLIIEDSHMLGLSQLYQLKGRVGRSHVKAYAYFLFPSGMQLTKEATDRLVALKENQDFGSGIKIAMRDLEIRGAGSLLGSEQSGNISAIGFESFTAMLAGYVEEARTGRHPAAFEDVVVDLPAEVYVPEEYVSDPEERVEVYRRLAFAREPEDVAAIAERLELEHGEMPVQMLNLICRSNLQLLMGMAGIKTISYVGGKVTAEPIKLGAEERQRAKDAGALYFPKTEKLTWRPKGTDDIYEQVLALLRKTLEA